MNILVVYSAKDLHPLRGAIDDHLYAFQRHSRHRCYYLNLSVRHVPAYLRTVQFDVIIFHTIFLIERWLGRARFAEVVARAQPLKQFPGIKVALPQDEYVQSDLLCQFINEFGIQHVFTVAPESEWPRLFDQVDRQKIRFTRVLTGYLDDKTVARIERLAASEPVRSIDIGYRAWRAEAWLGRLGFIKADIAEVFRQHAPDCGLRIDISTRPQDTFYGDDWYRFLLRCKYTIGVEGGSGIHDRDGSIKDRTRQYVVAHPDASFEEIEAACFPGRDGSLRLLAMSPRHLEACAARTCQVLVEGEYNGVLLPSVHYIELKRDFSNLDQVLATIKDDTQREEITARAYQDIVASRRYNSGAFAEGVVAAAVAGRDLRQAGQATLRERLIWLWAFWADRVSWQAVAFNAYRRRAKPRLRQAAVRLLSEERELWLMRQARRLLGRR